MKHLSLNKTFLGVAISAVIASGAYAETVTEAVDLKQFSKKSALETEGEIVVDVESKNPFSAFSRGEKAQSHLVNSDINNTLNFLKEQGLLETNEQKVSIVTGDNTQVKSDLLIRKVFASANCTLPGGACTTVSSSSCTLRGGSVGACGSSPEIDVEESGSTTVSEDFGSVAADGVATTTKTFTVKNEGTGNLTTTAVSITSGSSDFSITGGTCATNGQTLSSGMQCTILVTVQTTTVGGISGNLRISNTDANESMYNVSLSATGTSTNSAPVIDLNGGIPGTGSFSAFTEGSPAPVIAPDASAEDSDGDTITTITVALTNDQDGLFEGLNVSASAQNALGGVSGASDISLQDTISITGATATTSEVATFLKAITYNNTSSSPNTTSRTVSVVINDGTENSISRTATISVANLTAASSTAAGFSTLDGTNLNPAIMFSSDNETLTISNPSHITGSVADGGTGTDTIHVPTGSDLTAFTTLTGFETLSVPSSVTLTLSEAQHEQFTTISGSGAPVFTITAGSGGDANLTANSTIATYVLNTPIALTLVDRDQSVTGSNLADSVDISNFAYRGTLDGGDGTDTLLLIDGASIAAATISNFETLNLSGGGSLTMKVAQHNAFTTIIGSGTDQITISDATNSLIAANDIETYVLGSANTITLSNGSQNITGSTGNDTVNIAGLTVTGTLNANGGTDTLSMATGADTTSATVSSFENLTLATNSSVALSAAQVSTFTGTITASGAETITVSGDGNFTTLSNIEAFNVGDDSTNTRTITLGSSSVNVTSVSTTDANTFDVSGLTFTGTITGEASVNDTLSISNTGDITAATVSNIENLTLSSGARVSITRSQHAGFTGTISAIGSETIDVYGDGDFSTFSDVETYNVFDDSSNSRTITIVSATQSIIDRSSNTAMTFALGGAGFSGSLTSELNAADKVSVTDGADVTSGSFFNIGTLSLASTATVAIDVNNINDFNTAITGSAGADTLKLMDGGIFNFSSTTVSGIENLAIGTNSNTTITLTDNFNTDAGVVSFSNASGSAITAAVTLDASAFSADILTMTSSDFNGDDILKGGTGADTLRPGAGTDTLTGNAGNDNFVGSSSQLSGDTITDLAAGDRITITGITGLSASNVRFNGTSTLEVDTNATDFNISELTLSLTNAPGNDLAFTVADSGSDTLITFVSANSAPTFSSLNGGATFIEGFSAVTIDSDMTIADAELDALNSNAGDYNNASLTIRRRGGASAEDRFGHSGLLGTLTEGNTFSYNANNIGTVTTNSAGTLTLTFNSNATSAIVDSVAQAITYANNSDIPLNATVLDYTFNDGVVDSTGTNQASVTITSVNDAPTVSAVGANPTFTENGSAVGIFSSASISTVESGQDIEQISLTITNVKDTGHEFLQFGTDLINLEHNASGTYSGAVNFSYVVTLSGSTATVTVSATDSAAVWQNYVPFLQYKNTSESPTTDNRIVTLTSIKDSGGTANAGADRAIGSFGSSTVSVVGENNAPTDINLSSSTISESIVGAGADVGILSTTDVDSSSHTYSLVSSTSLAAGSCTASTGNSSFQINGSTLETKTALPLGIYTVCIQTNDSAATFKKSFAITVTEAPKPTNPEISGAPVTKVNQGEAYSFAPTATDPQNKALTFSIANKPSWASFSSATGNLLGTPVKTDVGLYPNIAISVSNGSEQASLPPFNLEVVSTNSAPVASNLSLELDEDSNISFSPDITDADSDTLTISAVSQPQFGTLTKQANTFTYTPNTNYFGPDSFNYLADDTKEKSAIATVNFTVASINDAPIANPDSYSLNSNVDNSYPLDVLVNDTDVDDDELVIVSANASVGSVRIENGSLIYQAQASTKGAIQINYLIEDPDKETSRTTATLTLNNQADNVPTIETPADIDVNAKGLFTKVKLGVPSATDSEGNKLAVSLVNPSLLYAPGKHLVYWKAVDSSGLEAIATQNVNVSPLISLSKNSEIAENKTHSFNVFLNGEAPSYPVTIAYEVSGTADSSDHDLVSSELVINSGMQGQVNFTTYADSETEGNETVVITLANTLNLGAKSSATITIVENNVAPTISASITQGSQQRSLVTIGNDLVTIKAVAQDANPNDNVTLKWVSEGNKLLNTSANENEFVFSTQSLTPGIYKVTVTAKDSGEPSLSTTKDVYVEVLTSLEALGQEDSDGDLIPDAQEGYGDSDGDGIPDYLDAISECNVMQEQVKDSDKFLVEGEPGVCVRKGVTVSQNATGGVQLLDSELPEDEGAVNTGGLFDFIATGLPNAGDTYSIVIPQRKPISQNSVYRKLKEGQWIDFDTSGDNQLLSTAGEPGYCPPPRSGEWTQGLIEGAWCVQLQIVDGGPNDDDGKANRSIVDPGGVAIVRTSNQLPEANQDEITIGVGESTTIDVLKNDTDMDGDKLTLSGATADFGDVSIVDEQLLYIPPAGFVGVAIIEYSISDGKGGTSNSQVKVNLVINNAPTAVFDSATTTDNTSIEIDVLRNDSDIDGDELFVVNAVAAQGTVSININGTLQYTPKSGFDGVDIIDYTIKDSKGAKSTAQVKVTVSAVKSVAINNKSSGGSMGGLGLLLISVLVISRRRSMFPSFAIVTTSCLISTSAMADTWSFEATLGESKAKHSLVTKDNKANLVSIDDTDTSWSIGAYYDLSPNWEVAIRYIDLGEGRADLTAQTVKADADKLHQDYSRFVPVLPKGVAAEVGYRHMLAESLNTKVFLGAYRHQYKIQSSTTDGARLEYKEHATKPYIGAALGYSVYKQTELLLKYTYYKVSKNDVSELSAGIKVRF
ncbi:Ig-like domain-containing protein [Pseudoalteromonas aliena]|uniref:Ig-like domain-containing protein n=1 Tax=Pseudoalteromonas aliena TaxID=247523 RepID=UPI002493EBC4|nr:Ig-like domain-containing protein [Pseudoalteromonas aliena]